MTDVPKPRPNFANIAFLSLTFLIALVGTPWYIVAHGLAWPEVITCIALWLAVGISVTAGYHRLFTHKTYQAAWPVRLSLLVFGAAAFENSVINWAADHRIHHSNVDHERDPYNIQRGFWWAHIGWIFYENEPISQTVVQDLLEDPLVRWQHRWYKELGVAVAFGIPLAVGLATGRVLGCLLIGGVLRVVISHHGTFFINSLCHMVGRQPYSRDHSARDSAVMAALAFGEGYHNYHHSFPFDYRNGIRPWHFDPAKWMIFGFSRLGLTRNLRRASDAAILKAKVDVQFETAKEKLARLAGLAREGYQQRLQEGYSILQLALRDLLALQRRPAREAAAADDLPRVGMVQRALEQALREWKETLHQLNRLSRATA